ncbi:MAG: D-alanyl-D-alanine carboxypeptidase family protein [Pyrinomonadaceae bacterium]
MTSSIHHRHFTAVVFIGLAFILSVYITRSFAQERRSSAVAQPTPLVTRTGKSGPSDAGSTRERVVETSAGRFAAAASANAQLRTSLAWKFGKAQTGWEIYVPLIAETVGTDASADSPAFAASVARWQAKNAMSPSGIVDADTIDALVKFWQARRRSDSAASYESDIVAVPIADFYDPTRSPDLLKLDRETYTAYKRMIAAATRDLARELRLTRTGELAPEEKFLKIVSAYRSPEYQEQLRRRSPGSGRIALAKNSVHFTGRAIDIYVGGEPTITRDDNRRVQVETPVYKWLVKNAHKFGFYPYFYEPWHWEYVPGK